MKSHEDGEFIQMTVFVYLPRQTESYQWLIEQPTRGSLCFQDIGCGLDRESQRLELNLVALLTVLQWEAENTIRTEFSEYKIAAWFELRLI